MINIVIPAYNEEKLLPNTLANLLKDNQLTQCQCVVVLNGCHDHSKAVIERFIKHHENELNNKQFSLHCLDIEKASKTNAINEGLAFFAALSNKAAPSEKKAPSKATVLLDADILIDGHSIIALVNELNGQRLKAMSPKVDFDVNASSFLVKHYYQVAAFSAYNQQKRLSNVIALSNDGLAKLGQLPEVVADDEYIRRQFACHEYAVSQHVTHTFTAPRNLPNLVKVLARVERGNLLLKKLLGPSESLALQTSEHKATALSLSIFFAIKLYAKFLARLQILVKNNAWGRDESTRI